MNKKEYNGWYNYETWNVALWMDNDQGEQEHWIEQAREAVENATPTYEGETDKDAATNDLADALESYHKENMPEVTGTYADLLQASLDEVNWREIAEHLISDLEMNEPDLFKAAVEA